MGGCGGSQDCVGWALNKEGHDMGHGHGDEHGLVWAKQLCRAVTDWGNCGK